jgi:hypothetical protein
MHKCFGYNDNGKHARIGSLSQRSRSTCKSKVMIWIFIKVQFCHSLTDLKIVMHKFVRCNDDACKSQGHTCIPTSWYEFFHKNALKVVSCQEDKIYNNLEYMLKHDDDVSSIGAWYPVQRSRSHLYVKCDDCE